MKDNNSAGVRGLLQCKLFAFVVMLFTISLTSAHCHAQAAKKSPVGKADYMLWSELMLEKISEDGKWVSYTLRNENADTTVVRSVGSNKQFKLPQASNGIFLGSLYLYYEVSGQVNILNLEKGKPIALPGSTGYHVLGNSGVAIEFAGGKLVVMDNAGKSRFEMEAAQFHAYNLKNGIMVYSEDRGGLNNLLARSINSNDSPYVITVCSQCLFSSVIYDEGGNANAFLQHNESSPGVKAAVWAGYYTYDNGLLTYLKPGETDGFPYGYEPTSSSFTHLKLSADGSKVFVGLLNKDKPVTRENFEVWNNHDKFLGSGKGWDYNNRMGVWWPGRSRFEQLTDSGMANMMLTGKQSHALLYNPFQYEPQFDRDGPSDIYIKELDAGMSKLLLARQYNIYGTVSVSPGGDYIAYFRNCHWYVYDIKAGIHRNITENIPSSFADEGNDEPQEDPPYGVGGWMDGDNAILLYDKHNIWRISLTGGGALNISGGKSKGAKFRIIPQNDWQSGHANFNGPRFGGRYGNNEDIVISATGKETNEYYKWHRRNGISLLVSSPNHISDVQQAGSGKWYVYLEQNYNIPPQVKFKREKRAPEIVYRSNPQHANYLWGESTVISYRNSNGDELHGILYFPSGYDPALRYPMVVHVYQVQSHQAKYYIRPTEHNTAGLNIANLQAQGYIVLLPDIKYTIGQPGPSALDCVLAGVSRAKAVASVDSEKIALIGHSFGGFEAAYIISHSDVFATAILGSAITDFRSSYFYVNPHLSNANFWRYEYGQFRMGSSFFEDKEGYYLNSPITSAENIKVPVLIWAGQQDKQVHHFQGTALYLALRRLERQAVLLLYPDQGHIMWERERQDDLTSKIEDWLEHYLKGSPEPFWLK